ncbi:mechanosensitive ion channel protein 4/5/6/7/8/9/10 [Marchantia polymorpha subsp. ruderalis]|uniref:Mechanosensitive ion channel MscS domain-containing protein n=2 Tax=Marchantia polymorpha TaxID=3197 RepID=A0AAF6ANN0_MARPO|nr:hypothetical protein MARPO_0014s0185 [Marchantia polymorpha]BBM98050.1 hypothetical protein Mp_1g10420 [Marchantia polymorpha subsp. ruderalis]|eukprot:PTQ45676.1 hypothetical protein MARPO_0014s0185 [Marchantia polymorpha]
MFGILREFADALTDPIPEDEEHHGGPEGQSSSAQETGDAGGMEDDIESQRASSGSAASTSANHPQGSTSKKDQQQPQQQNEAQAQREDGKAVEVEVEDMEAQSGLELEPRRNGRVGDAEQSALRTGDPSEDDGPRPLKKERSSWDFEADDSFKFESGGPLPEPEKPPDPPPVFAPPFVRNRNDYRAKLMHLSELTLTLPPSPTGPEPPDAPGLQAPGDGDQGQSQSQSPQELGAGDQGPPLTCRRKPPRPTFARQKTKTRLQDPPPMTPAVSDQIASIWSDAGRSSRRGSLIHQPVEDDGQAARFGPVTSRRVSSTMNNFDGEPMLTSRGSRKSVTMSVTDAAAVAAAAGSPSPAPPAAAPSRLGMFSPSVMFSPSRLGLLSKSKANLVQPPPEEEVDPLDDDSIPNYKKLKSKERRWLVWIQWIGLFILILVMILAIKMNKLQLVVWKEIQLWQWLALATVIISGRLIAGWLVMILVALIERHYILKKRVLYFVYGLRHAVKNVVWLALVIGVWKLVFRHVESKGNIPIVTKVLWCLFTTACLWMVKILAVKVAANSFHRAAYFDRVQDCLFHQYVLETLSAPRSQETDYSHWDAVDSQAGRSHEPHLPSNLPPVQQDLQPSSSSSSRLPTMHEQQPNYGAAVVPETQRESERASHLASGPSRSNLASSLASPSRSNLGMASPSRSNLRAPSRATMGAGAPYAQPSQVLSPSGRLRRVSVLMNTSDGGTILARSTSPIQQEKLQELTSETVSAWTMKKLMKMIRKTNIATFSSMLDQEAGEKIDSEAMAKAAAKQIFYNIARPGEKFLTLTDFLYFLPEDQATRAFGLFEVNDLGHITKKALMKWVVNIYKERRALALTLSDNRTVVAKLHRVLDVLLLAVAITICFLIMGVNTQKLIVGFSSVLLPSVFVFGNAARSTFESLIFLFVMHPFDVGDRICVDGMAMIVEEMNILNTILLSGSNEKIYYPNSVLATKAISNYYRSPDQWDSIEFQIHATTPVEQLGLLKERMTKYIESLPQFWYPVFRIVCKDIEDSTRMKMALWVQHHLNYQESGERWQRRSNMILHMKTQLQDLGIGFHLPRQEITVTGVPVLDVPPHRSIPTPM